MKTAHEVKDADPTLVGAGVLDVGAALRAETIYTQQRWQPATGTGSLEAARGNSHVTVADGTALTGEQDVFGNDFSATAWAGDVWADDTWAGSRWSGSRWSGSRWSSAEWAGSRWSSEEFLGSRWSGVTLERVALERVALERLPLVERDVGLTDRRNRRSAAPRLATTQTASLLWSTPIWCRPQGAYGLIAAAADADRRATRRSGIAHGPLSWSGWHLSGRPPPSSSAPRGIGGCRLSQSLVDDQRCQSSRQDLVASKVRCALPQEAPCSTLVAQFGSSDRSGCCKSIPGGRSVRGRAGDAGSEFDALGHGVGWHTRCGWARRVDGSADRPATRAGCKEDTRDSSSAHLDPIRPQVGVARGRCRDASLNHAAGRAS